MHLEPPQLVLLLAAVWMVALLYSSVGHGGATGYLAVMALLSIGPAIAKPGALWMNCLVASIAFWRFRRAGCFDWRLFLPLASASIPMAWLGSHVHWSGRVLSWVVGLALGVAGWLLTRGRYSSQADQEPRPVSAPTAMIVGAVLGFVAGITGIGGGVYLTPVLILLGWSSTKTAAGVSALFIVANSAAGLVGLGSRALVWEPAMILAVLVGLAGALTGTYLSVKQWSHLGVRKVLALVLFLAAAKCFFTATA